MARKVIINTTRFVEAFEPVQTKYGIEIAGLRREVPTSFEYAVPYQYDLVIRYLKKYFPGAARHLHEYWPEPRTDGWGWQLLVDGNFLILRSYGALNRFGQYKSEMRLSFKTRSDKRLTLGIISGVLGHYHETVRMKK